MRHMQEGEGRRTSGPIFGMTRRVILRVGEVVEQVRSEQRRASGAMSSPMATRA